MLWYVAQGVVGVSESCNAVLGFTTEDADDWKFVSESGFEFGLEERIMVFCSGSIPSSPGA